MRYLLFNLKKTFNSLSIVTMAWCGEGQQPPPQLITTINTLASAQICPRWGAKPDWNSFPSSNTKSEYLQFVYHHLFSCRVLQLRTGTAWRLLADALLLPFK
jgi:hypothetical protein